MRRNSLYYPNYLELSRNNTEVKLIRVRKNFYTASIYVYGNLNEVKEFNDIQVQEFIDSISDKYHVSGGF